jgi:rare lipoprotein A
MKPIALALAGILAASQAVADTHGIASWYSTGRITASGETYDKHQFTAASRTLPFGTMVLVTRLDTREGVVVRINDRGPFARGRVIDLSEAAGKAIGIHRIGVAKVRLRVIGTPR